MNTNLNEIVLIEPPFSASSSPYISCPTLLAWLKQAGIKTRYLDASRELCDALLSREKIEKAYRFACRTFIELNNKEQLSPSETIFFIKLKVLLRTILPVYDEWHQKGFRDCPQSILIDLVSTTGWPDFSFTPIGLYPVNRYSIYSSSDLINAAAEDFFFTEDLEQLLIRRLTGTNMLVAAISVVFDEQVIPALQCARIIKQNFPQTHVTIGGPFATIHLRKLENNRLFSLFNSIVLDEGEIPLTALYRELSRKTADLATVPGLIWRDPDGKIIRNKNTDYIPLEQLPPPDYSHCDLENYPNNGKMDLSVRLSKGCHWRRCSFCRVQLSLCRNYCQPDGETVYKNLCNVIDSTGVTRYLFSDESCAPHILEYISEQLCREKREISWTFHTRVAPDALSRERVELFKRAGCSGFTVGIETYNNRLLKLINKGITEADIDRLLEQIKGVLPISAYMIMGLPTETEDDFRRSLKTVQAFKKDGLLTSYNYSLFCLAAGSPMWKHPDRYGIHTIEPDHENDLIPNMYTRFESEGMSRLEVCNLYFSWRRRKMHDNPDIPFIIDGKPHFSRFRTNDIVANIGEHFFRQLDAPLARWMAEIDRECSPITGADPWWMIDV